MTGLVGKLIGGRSFTKFQFLISLLFIAAILSSFINNIGALAPYGPTPGDGDGSERVHTAMLEASHDRATDALRVVDATLRHAGH